MEGWKTHICNWPGLSSFLGRFSSVTNSNTSTNSKETSQILFVLPGA